jgi:peptidoglycan glycosyltransferase
MALIASAICNDGDLKVPYVVEKVENLNKVEVKSFESEDYGQILTEAQANELEELMRYVVTDGTASALNTDDYTVYGKTGSAEYTSNKDDTHSWFVGYAKDGDKEIALAIVLEGAGSGSKHAVPLAKVMFEEYFNEQ